MRRVHLNTVSGMEINCASGQCGVRHRRKLGNAFRWTSVTKMALINVEVLRYLLSRPFHRIDSKMTESIKHVKCESRIALAWMKRALRRPRASRYMCRKANFVAGVTKTCS